MITNEPVRMCVRLCVMFVCVVCVCLCVCVVVLLLVVVVVVCGAPQTIPKPHLNIHELIDAVWRLREG